MNIEDRGYHITDVLSFELCPTGRWFAAFDGGSKMFTDDVIGFGVVRYRKWRSRYDWWKTRPDRDERYVAPFVISDGQPRPANHASNFLGVWGSVDECEAWWKELQADMAKIAGCET